MRIELTLLAKEDLTSINLYLKRDNPNLVSSTLNNLGLQIMMLSDFPNRGRDGTIEGTKELVMPKLPYYVIYEIYEEKIKVLRIYHTSRRPLTNAS